LNVVEKCDLKNIMSFTDNVKVKVKKLTTKLAAK